MKFTNVLQLALLAVLQVNAASAAKQEALTPNPANELVSRTNITLVKCGPPADQRVWSHQSVQDAYKALVTNGALSDPYKPVAGNRSYPRQYGKKKGVPTDEGVVAALNAIPECRIAQPGFKFFEFPLTMPVFTGGMERSQGKDRVVAISPSPGQGDPRTFTFCLVMTHSGGTGQGNDSSFRPCERFACL